MANGGGTSMDPGNARQLPRPTRSLDRAKSDLDRFGYCLLAEALGAKRLAAVRTRLYEQALAEKQAGDAYFDKGEAYYFSAASQLKGMKRGRSALSDVLEKLSCRFGLYVAILRLMKQRADNYLSFHFRISQAEMQQLERDLSQEMQKRRDAGTGRQG